MNARVVMHYRAHRHRGAAALVVTVLLCFAMALAVAYVHRTLVIDQRTAAHQVRATRAFEAAEAGIEWTLASLNDNRRVGADCMPSADVAATSVRDLLLERAAVDAPFVPRTSLDHGVPTPLQVACDSSAAGWVCACPAAGTPAVGAPSIDRASFVVQLAVGDGPGVVKVVATGCSTAGSACDAAATHESTARVTTSFALLRGLTSMPAAPLVARGDVNGDSAAWLAVNADASSGGLAVHAGGDVHASLATLQGPAGSASVESVAVRDAALAGRTPSRFFAAFFGVDDTRWLDRAGVRHITCRDDCSATLRQAITDGGRNALFAVDGDLRMNTPVTLGSVERPIVIVATGAVQLNAPVAFVGALYGASFTAAPSAAGSTFDGVVVSAGNVNVGAASTFIADAAVLARIKADTGTFARVSGSWRDF